MTLFPTPSDDLLSAHLDGETSPGEAAEVARRLAESDDARAELADLQAMGELVRTLPRLTAPPGLRGAVLERIVPPTSAPTPARTTTRRRAWWVGAGLAATAAAGVWLAVGLFDRRPAVAPQVASNEIGVRTDDVAVEYNEAIAEQSSDVPTPLGVNVKGADIAAADAVRQQQADRTELAAAKALPAPSAAPSGGMAGNAALNDFDEFWRVGDVISSLEQDGDRVLVVEATVVDVQQAAGELQLLFAKNRIPVAQRDRTLRFSDSLEPPDLERPERKTSEMLGVYVESSPTQIGAALRDFAESEQFVDFDAAGDLPPAEVALLALTRSTPPAVKFFGRGITRPQADTPLAESAPPPGAARMAVPAEAAAAPAASPDPFGMAKPGEAPPTVSYQAVLDVSPALRARLNRRAGAAGQSPTDGEQRAARLQERKLLDRTDTPPPDHESEDRRAVRVLILLDTRDRAEPVPASPAEP